MKGSEAAGKDMGEMKIPASSTEFDGVLGVAMSAKELDEKVQATKEALKIYRQDLSRNWVHFYLVCAILIAITGVAYYIIQFESLVALPLEILVAAFLHNEWIGETEKKIYRGENELKGYAQVADHELGELYNYAADCPEIVNYVKSVYQDGRWLTRDEYQQLMHAAGHMDRLRHIVKAKKAFGVEQTLDPIEA